ncbi:MAG: hypothetical protein COW45_06360 [Gallionellales bacterium CG17_big_fil_post_rev_8_21_14_2_50_54_146]|nr:MAG: hypothetical protein COW45_06360 [Gallionellales bacterium CG17_big_fil_post_rev_8_21_14_2_50_54_146]
MHRSILLGITLAVMSNASFAEGFSLNPFMLLTPKDATNYCTKMAATIQDRPECQKYKNEIMSYSKGNPADGKTTTPILAAREKAKASGCTK